MAEEERVKRFWPYWAVRVLWLGLVLALLWQINDGAPAQRLLTVFAIAFTLQLLFLVLALAKRLPAWHDIASTVAAALLGAVILATLPPEQASPLLLVGLLPSLDLARWRGWLPALFLLLLFPIAPFLYQTLRDLPVALSPLNLAIWLLTAVLGIVLAGLPATRAAAAAEREKLAENPETILARAAERLVRDTNYDSILNALVREGASLLDLGTRKAQTRGMALTFKPGLADVLVVGALHHLEDAYKGRTFPARGVLARMLQEGEPAYAPTNQPPFEEVHGFEGHQLLLFPLRTNLDVFGVLVFATRNIPQAENPEIQRTLIALADQASLALHNAVLHQELSHSRDQRLVGEEEARHQLARQLHDGPVQRIAAITMQLEFVKALMTRHPDRAQAEIDQLQQAAKMAAQEIRTMLFMLRPVVLETEGLVAALETYVQRLREQDRLNISYQADPVPRLDSKVEEVGFAIMQEAIGNAKKYAGKANIHVRLIMGHNMLVGQVEDEGPGFDLAATTASYGTRASLGLLNMQERAAMVGGQLKIDTAPGRGTIVSVALPLRTS